MRSQLARLVMAGTLATSALTMAAPAAAQDDEARIRKLEAEVRALQRSVFPGGDGRYFTPEVSPETGAQPSVGTPAQTVAADMLVRMESLEGAIQQLTARAEQAENQVALLTNRLDAAERRLAANAVTTTTTNAGGGTTAPATTATVTTTTTAAPTPTPAATAPTPARLAAVQAIAKPSSGDAGDDEYTYGFRLWDAGFYPEAQQQLRLFVDRFPNHSRTSYGRNLLGRAFLDDGKPREAAPWFLENYQKDEGGARAGDSLLYLAEAMIAMSDTQRACIALAEFGETYPALAAGRLKGQYDANRARVTCT